jgi:hypothetical protein
VSSTQQQPSREREYEEWYRQHHTETTTFLGLIFAFIFPPLGFILSVVGLRRTRREGTRGAGYAVAGLVISGLALFIALVGLLLAWQESRPHPAPRSAVTHRAADMDDALPYEYPDPDARYRLLSDDEWAEVTHSEIGDLRDELVTVYVRVGEYHEPAAGEDTVTIGDEDIEVNHGTVLVGEAVNVQPRSDAETEWADKDTVVVVGTKESLGGHAPGDIVEVRASINGYATRANGNWLVLIAGASASVGFMDPAEDVTLLEHEVVEDGGLPELFLTWKVTNPLPDPTSVFVSWEAYDPASGEVLTDGILQTRKVEGRLDPRSGTLRDGALDEWGNIPAGGSVTLRQRQFWKEPRDDAKFRVVDVSYRKLVS